MPNECFFCDVLEGDKSRIVSENRLFCAKFSNYPVSPGHCEIFPKEHILSFFSLSEEQLKDLYEVIGNMKYIIDRKHNPDGFNIGINEGEAAGRTVHHLHVHIIPRYDGDMKNPQGGVRNIFPEKGDYLSEPDRVESRK